MTTLTACPVCATPRPADRRGGQPWCCSLACYRIFHAAAGDRPDGATTTCPMCQRSFRPVGGHRFCSDACRVADYRRRLDATSPPLTRPRAQPRPPITVYACDSCGARAVGRQRCPGCSTSMRKIGLGGECPCCGEAVAITELLAQEVIAID